MQVDHHISLSTPPGTSNVGYRQHMSYGARVLYAEQSGIEQTGQRFEDASVSSYRTAQAQVRNFNLLAGRVSSSGASRTDYEEVQMQLASDYRSRTSSRSVVSRGLRQFSVKVLEKVRDKRVTTYNVVADELVEEYFAELHSSAQTLQTKQRNDDTKNIRRRVYDALNVLLAMDIIAKDRKDLRWVGLPKSTEHELDYIERKCSAKKEVIDEKRLRLHELIVQQVAFKSLIDRNAAQGQEPSTSQQATDTNRLGVFATPDKDLATCGPSIPRNLFLPFVVAVTARDTTVECSIAPDKSKYQFTFDNLFELQDDVEIIKRLGLDHGLSKGVCLHPEVKSYLPVSLRRYIDEIAPEASGRHEVPLFANKKILTLKRQAEPHGGHGSEGKQIKIELSVADPETKRTRIAFGQLSRAAAVRHNAHD